MLPERCFRFFFRHADATLLMRHASIYFTLPATHCHSSIRTPLLRRLSLDAISRHRLFIELPLRWPYYAAATFADCRRLRLPRRHCYSCRHAPLSLFTLIDRDSATPYAAAALLLICRHAAARYIYAASYAF